MDPIYCARCDDSEVESEGALCPACVEQMNEDAGIDARSKMNRIVSALAEIEELNEGHGADCGCMLCEARSALRRLVLSLRKPGFDSLFAEGWRAHGITPWTHKEERRVH